MIIHKISQRGLRLALTVVLLLTVPACTVEDVAEGGSSPEDVYERLRSAIAEEDFSEIVRCMEPEKRPLLSMSMFIGASMVVALTSAMGEMMGEMTGEFAASLTEGLAESFGGELSEEERQKLEEQTDSMKTEVKDSTVDLEAQLQAVLDKHGVGHLTAEDSTFDLSGDFESMASEVFADVDHGTFVADLFSILNQAGEDNDDGFTSKYPDVSLTDVVVTGQRAKGKAGKEEIEFVEVDGRWYLAFDMQSGMS